MLSNIQTGYFFIMGEMCIPAGLFIMYSVWNVQVNFSDGLHQMTIVYILFLDGHVVISWATLVLHTNPRAEFEASVRRRQ